MRFPKIKEILNVLNFAKRTFTKRGFRNAQNYINGLISSNKKTVNKPLKTSTSHGFSQFIHHKSSHSMKAYRPLGIFLKHSNTLFQKQFIKRINLRNIIVHFKLEIGTRISLHIPQITCTNSYIHKHITRIFISQKN